MRQTPGMTPSMRNHPTAATPSQPFATPGNPLSTPQYQATPRGHWSSHTPGGSAGGRTPASMSGGRTPGSVGSGRTPASSAGGSSSRASAQDWANLAEQWAKGKGDSEPQSQGRDRRSPRTPVGHSPYPSSHHRSSRTPGQSPYSRDGSSSGGGGGGGGPPPGHSPYSSGGGSGRHTPGTPRASRTPRRTPGTPRDPRDGGSTPLWDET